jgi:hypothetical protein
VDDCQLALSLASTRTRKEIRTSHRPRRLRPSSTARNKRRLPPRLRRL